MCANLALFADFFRSFESILYGKLGEFLFFFQFSFFCRVLVNKINRPYGNKYCLKIIVIFSLAFQVCLSEIGTLKPKNFSGKNFGGNIFGRFLQLSAENFSDKFYNVGKIFGLKKYDRFGKRAVFKGPFIEIVNQMTQNYQRLDTETKIIHFCMQ